MPKPSESNLFKAAIAFLFFALIGFIFLFGLLDWSK